MSFFMKKKIVSRNSRKKKQSIIMYSYCTLNNTTLTLYDPGNFTHYLYSPKEYIIRSSSKILWLNRKLNVTAGIVLYLWEYLINNINVAPILCHYVFTSNGCWLAQILLLKWFHPVIATLLTLSATQVYLNVISSNSSN